ncbi:hypothetical protein [Streptomyces sp. NPDC054865]
MPRPRLTKEQQQRRRPRLRPDHAGLLASLPFAVTGAGLLASGTATVRTAAHAT